MGQLRNRVHRGPGMGSKKKTPPHKLVVKRIEDNEKSTEGKKEFPRNLSNQQGYNSVL